MFYAIDHNSETLLIKGAPTEASLTKKDPPEELQRVIVGNVEQLSALDPALLLRIAQFKSKVALTELPPVSEIWAMLSPPPKAKKTAKTQNNELTSPSDSPNSDSTGGTPPPEATGKKEAKVAKAKSKTKSKKVAKRAATNGSTPKGMPREGSKAAKLLDLISRKGGATFAEMKKVTGWKEMRGTALTLARRAGKTLTMNKEEGKAPRWEAK